MKKELTVEQKKEVRKHITKYMWRFLFLTYAYLAAIFLGNWVIAMIDLAYMHNPMFLNAASFGSTMVLIIGLRTEQDNAYNKMKSEIQKISQEAGQ